MTPNAQQQMSRALWFEIPVNDLDRACRFYERVLHLELKQQQFGRNRIATFPYPSPAAGGCLATGEGFQPGASGSRVSLNVDPKLDEALARVEPNGGAIVTPKTALPPGMGFYATIRDTEGNTVGLHAIS